MLDLFNREFVGWSLTFRMMADRVMDADQGVVPQGAAVGSAPPLRRRQPGCKLYTLQHQLAAYGRRASMSRKGNCWDNAPAESLFNRSTASRTSGCKGTRYATRAEATAHAFDRMEAFCNRKRRHGILGYQSPVQLLESWISDQSVKTPAV